MLNRIWTFFFLGGFVAAVARAATGHPEVWRDMVGSTFDTAETAFKIALGLTGVMCLWLGIMRMGEDGGAVATLARLFGPLLRRLFPGVPAGHPASASIVMNMAANMLGLDNAATPLGLKAMKELQTLNPDPDTASDDQILFLVINTSAVTVIPVTIFTYRAQMGAADPTDIFLPILIATYCSTMVGLLTASFFQKIRLQDPVVLGYLGGILAFAIGGTIVAIQNDWSSLVAGFVSLIGWISLLEGALLLAFRKRFLAFFDGWMLSTGFVTGMGAVTIFVGGLLWLAVLIG